MISMNWEEEVVPSILATATCLVSLKCIGKDVVVMHIATNFIRLSNCYIFEYSS